MMKEGVHQNSTQMVVFRKQIGKLVHRLESSIQTNAKQLVGGISVYRSDSRLSKSEEDAAEKHV